MSVNRIKLGKFVNFTIINMRLTVQDLTMMIVALLNIEWRSQRCPQSLELSNKCDMLQLVNEVQGQSLFVLDRDSKNTEILADTVIDFTA